MRNFNIKREVRREQTQERIKRRKDSFQPFYAKVLSINLTDQTTGLGKIIFEPLERGVETATVALPMNYGIKQYPLVGELVQIHPSPEDGSDLVYTNPANTQNTPTTQIVDGAFADSSIERADINPLLPFPGDTLLEGRYGQSIRLSHFNSQQHPWLGEGALGGAITIISNGQKSTEDGTTAILEDINEDASILALLENASIGITDQSKRDSYEEAIENGYTFRGNQAILASGRLFLNARDESILLSAQNASIGLSSDTVNIDGVSSIRLDAPSYNLQTDTFTSANQTRNIGSETATYNYDQFTLNGTNINVNHSRIVLGEGAAEPLLQSTEFLADLAALNVSLTQLSTALAGLNAILSALPGGQVPAATLQTAATSVSTQANQIQTKVGSGAYLSTTVFTK